MSYFDTLNQFVENAQQANAHLDEYKNNLVASKVGDIKDKYDQYINSIENYGQATIGVASAYHLGRKIYKKTKEKYGKEPKKEKPEGEEPEEPIKEGEVEVKNPAFDPENDAPVDLLESTTSSENPAGVRNKEEQEAGENDRSAEGSAEEPPAPPEVGDMPEGAGGRAAADDIRGGIPKTEPEGDIKSLGQSETPLSEEQARAFTKDATPESTEMDGFGEIANTAKTELEQKGKQIADKFIANAGEKLAEKVGFDVVGAAADAIPVVGEVAGLFQIFHGLHKEFKERRAEGKEEQQAGESIRASGQVSVGGVDLGAVSQSANIGGLV